MRFPSFGVVKIPEVKKETPRFIPVEDDLTIAVNTLKQLHTKISELEQKNRTCSPEEREKVQQEMVLVKIALAETEIKKQFLEEESTLLVRKEAANQDEIGKERYVA